MSTHVPQPLPRDITLSRVREILERYVNNAYPFHWFTVADVILCMNGYDPTLQPPHLGKSLAAAKAKLQKSQGSTLDGEPTAQQKTVTRAHLMTLLKQGLVKQQRSHGNGFEYRWITPAMIQAQELRKQTEARGNALSKRLAEAFQVRTDSHAIRFTVLADNTTLKFEVAMSEVAVERVIKALK